MVLVVTVILREIMDNGNTKNNNNKKHEEKHEGNIALPTNTRAQRIRESKGAIRVIET